MRHLSIISVALLSLIPVHILVYGEHALFINICFLNNTLSVTHAIFPLYIMMYIVRNVLYYHLLFYYTFLPFEPNYSLIQLFFFLGPGNTYVHIIFLIKYLITHNRTRMNT